MSDARRGAAGGVASGAGHGDLHGGAVRLGEKARRAIKDLQLQQFVGVATTSKDRARKDECASTFGDGFQQLRSAGARVRRHALDRLDVYLGEYVARARAAGIQVHFAANGEQANAICIDIAKKNSCRRCVKSKSMVTEETGLVAAMEEAGIPAVETDLGEFILQLDHDTPSHIVTPMIHKDRTAVGRAFQRELGVAYTDDPMALTAIARQHLRAEYQRADLGVSGANFLVAETGSIVLCTNEGNGRFCTSVPRVHIAVAGIEKVVAKFEHLSVLLKLLARSSTAQPLTCYTHIINGPRRAGELDGPEQVHVVLLDNGRSSLLAEETRELLQCIRCGACLNSCPVYRKIGGHSYGSVYSGPIGATITPWLQGLSRYRELPHASSLCGACRDACPVRIDLPKQLIHLRKVLVQQRVGSRGERLAFAVWAWVLMHPGLYRFASKVQRVLLRFIASRQGGASAGDGLSDGYGERGWIARGPGPLGAWTARRDFPTPTARSFRDWWREDQESGGER